MASYVSTNEKTQATAFIAPLAQTLAAFAFGAIIVLAVGFLPMSAAHNAAHDTRHAMAFPCH